DRYTAASCAFSFRVLNASPFTVSPPGECRRSRVAARNPLDGSRELGSHCREQPLLVGLNEEVSALHHVRRAGRFGLHLPGVQPSLEALLVLSAAEHGNGTVERWLIDVLIG